MGEEIAEPADENKGGCATATPQGGIELFAARQDRHQTPFKHGTPVIRDGRFRISKRNLQTTLNRKIPEPGNFQTRQY